MEWKFKYLLQFSYRVNGKKNWNSVKYMNPVYIRGLRWQTTAVAKRKDLHLIEGCWDEGSWNPKMKRRENFVEYIIFVFLSFFFFFSMNKEIKVLQTYFHLSLYIFTYFYILFSCSCKIFHLPFPSSHIEWYLRLLRIIVRWLKFCYFSSFSFYFFASFPSFVCGFPAAQWHIFHHLWGIRISCDGMETEESVRGRVAQWEKSITAVLLAYLSIGLKWCSDFTDYIELVQLG